MEEFTDEEERERRDCLVSMKDAMGWGLQCRTTYVARSAGHWSWSCRILDLVLSSFLLLLMSPAGL